MKGDRLYGAGIIRGEALEHDPADVLTVYIEASIRTWRREQDLTLRLNGLAVRKRIQTPTACTFAESPRWELRGKSTAVC